MSEKIRQFIVYSYYLLFFFLAFILFPRTSELFEFNKMVFTYAATIVIFGLWMIRIIIEKKKIFRRTIIDIPILLFLLTQLLSTITSIDFRTSLLGYYSRFHGGFLSSISYALLYWAYVSNIKRVEVKRTLFCLLASAAIVSVYGVLEHFGIDKDIWIQDVQNRVFSSLGQPNWLAAWLVSLIPIAWAFSINSTKRNDKLLSYFRNRNFLLWIFISSFLFLTLLYTKSRSGILGFSASYAVFFLLFTFFNKLQLKNIITKVFLISIPLLLITILVGTPWTPSVEKYIKQRAVVREIEQEEHEEGAVKAQSPALEVGGSRSTEIRKIVWKGAIDIWKNYPILGTGVETFAFSYYNFRPIEHNLVSEWDFLYNKAHNEYLNFAATTGTLGLASYLFLIASIIYCLYKLLVKEPIVSVKNHQYSRKIARSKIKNDLDKNSPNINITLALVSGFVSILVTNFFGFSVVCVGLSFFLFPAIAISIHENMPKGKDTNEKELTLLQKFTIVFVVFCALFLLVLTGRYWYADYLYAYGTGHNDAGNFVEAKKYLDKATAISTKEAVYWSELSESSSSIAIGLFEAEENELTVQYALNAIKQSDKANQLSSKNVNLKRKRASLFITLSLINPSYLSDAKETLYESIELAPTDAKLFYNLALVHLKMGEDDRALELFKQTIDMKPNYKKARYALSLILIDKGETQRAKEELIYILEKISPNDKKITQELEELESK